MLCRIAELYVEVPEAGGMASRCQGYLTDPTAKPDMVISAERYRPERWKGCSYELACYMESGYHFYGQLLRFGGMLLHASAVAYQGRAYLFSGPCTVGKSTHTRLWQQTFGQDAQVINDDKPALRQVDGRWYAYGTPWCGKDGINQNEKVPVAGICFLKQGAENNIRRLAGQEALLYILSQTQRFEKTENMDILLRLVDALVRTVPIYELENTPNPAAARLSYETMRSGMLQ